MADWFKIYENDLDEMRLQWAIGELPEVLNVWIVLLAEACRHKSGTLSGYSQDFELFGISKRINVSVPKVNQAIQMLIKISYIERNGDGLLHIRKWDEKQSEYCQKKTRLQNQYGDDNPMRKHTKKENSVRIVSGQTPESVGQEERRGDKNIKGDTMVVLEYLNNKAGTAYRPVDSNLRLIKARIDEGASLDDLKAVVDLKVKDWLGKEEAKYLRPETLFNATKFNSYVGLVGMNKNIKSFNNI